MTDNEYLRAVLNEQTLARNGPELTALRERREDVEQLLRSEFGNAPRIDPGGSFAKRTMIKEAYDLDLTCYFGHEDNEAGENLREIYNNVAAVLGTTYMVHRKGSAIRIRDARDATDFYVDVVPGRFVDGKEGDVFLYQSTGDKERLKTNLEKHIKHVRESGVTDAIRLMKLWRVRNKVEVKTFVLELLVIKLLEGKEDKPLTEQLTYVWEKLRDDTDNLSVEDPANRTGNDLSELLNAGVRQQLSVAAGHALDTIEHSGWQAVFGEIQSDDEDEAAALERIAIMTPRKSKPWASGE